MAKLHPPAPPETYHVGMLGALVEQHRRIMRETAHLEPKEIFVEQGSKAWHMQRRGRLTGSNLAAAAGLNPHKSRAALWKEITGRVETEDLSGNPYVAWGSHHEDAAARAYEGVTGNWGTQRPGMVLDGIDPWLAVSPDRWAGPKLEPDPERGSIYMEIKCPGKKALYDDVPPYYMPQVQGGLSITRRKVCHFVCYVPSLTEFDPESGEDKEATPEQIRVWEVAYSEEYDAVLRYLLRGFQHHVVHHLPPGRLAQRPQMPDVNVRLLHDGFVKDLVG